jgi:MFS family permease
MLKDSWYLLFVVFVSAMGGLLFGYDWVVIGGAKPFYEAYFHLVKPAGEAWAMSCALAGCLIGATSSGYLSERFGRRPALLISALMFTISSLGTGLAASFTTFVAWRIAGGAAIGLASGLSPVYIAEISPAGKRGELVSLNELTIVFGILLAQITNWWIARPVSSGLLCSKFSNHGTARWVGGGCLRQPQYPQLSFWLACSSFPRARDGWRERAHSRKHLPF